MLTIKNSKVSLEQQLGNKNALLQKQIDDLNALQAKLDTTEDKLATAEKVQSTDQAELATQIATVNAQIDTCQKSLDQKIKQYNLAQQNSTTLQQALDSSKTMQQKLQEQLDKYKALLSTKSKIIYEQTTPPGKDFLGSDQGAYFEQVCPKDQIVTGFKGHAGNSIRGVGVTCGGSSFKYTDNAYFYPAGYENDQQFNSNFYTNGFNSLGARTGADVDQIAILNSDDGSTLQTFGGNGGSYDALQCKSGSKIVGIKGRIGTEGIRGIGIKCGEPKSGTFTLD